MHTSWMDVNGAGLISLRTLSTSRRSSEDNRKAASNSDSRNPSNKYGLQIGLTVLVPTALAFLFLDRDTKKEAVGAKGGKKPVKQVISESAV